MPYCPSCGKEHAEEAMYCSNCGANLLGPEEGTYRKYREPRRNVSENLGRGVIALIALIVLVAGFGMAMGGFAILSVHSNFVDSDGYIMSYPVDLTVDSYAIVQKAVHISIDTDYPIWIPNLGDFVKLKIVASSNRPSNNLFIGIADESDASRFLSGVNYHEVEDFEWEYNPWSETPPMIAYSEKSGGLPQGSPLVHSFWSAHISGSGVQTLIWEPEIGDFWVVGMNADGSENVDIEVQMGVRLPILRTVGGILLIIGLILLLVAFSLFREVI